MAKRFMIYLRLQPRREDGLKVYTVINDFSSSMWPDGTIYFSVHKNSVTWKIDIGDLIHEEVRLDKFKTFDDSLMREIINTTLERIKKKGYCIILTRGLPLQITAEAKAIMEERR